MYFPLIVHEALMVEPTETESRETLDEAIEVFHKIYEQALADPEALHSAPHLTPIGRPDELRRPVSRYCAIHGNDENEIGLPGQPACPWLCMDIPDIRTWPGKGLPRQPFYRMETDMINRLVWMETDNTYPYRNLAMEEYMTLHVPQGTCILYLWQTAIRW